MWLCCEKSYNYTSCIQSFVKLCSEHNYSCIDQHKKFISFRNNGGLISAFLNVFKIMSETEKYLLLLTDDLKFRYKNYIFL